jgi:hypothetical protein
MTSAEFDGDQSAYTKPEDAELLAAQRVVLACVVYPDGEQIVVSTNTAQPTTETLDRVMELIEQMRQSQAPGGNTP